MTTQTGPVLTPPSTRPPMPPEPPESPFCRLCGANMTLMGTGWVCGRCGWREGED